MSINKVMVVGAGLMGSGITQVIASSGVDVVMVDQQMTFANKGLSRINESLNKLRSKDKLSQQDVNRILKHIQISDQLNSGSDADLIIEAVSEKLEIKQKVFSDLDSIIKPDVILATNTSSLSIASIGSVTTKREKVIGMHFFSPVPIMKLVEIIPSLVTDQETIDQISSFSSYIGKDPILAKDYPGFTVNRLLVPMLNEAAYLVYEGVDPESIDKGMKIGANHPIGPLKLSDQIGLDVLLDVLESMYEGFNDPKYRPCPLLKRMVEAGRCGRKTNQGFYQYITPRQKI